MKGRIILTLGVVAAVLLATPLNAMAQPGGGGNVPNQVPSVESFTQIAAVGSADVGYVEEFEGEVRDKNSEGDLTTLTIDIAGDVVATFTRTITATDLSTDTEPLDYGNDDWKVWNSGAAKDGFLSFKFQFEYAERGTHDWSVTVTDDDADTATSGPISVELYEFEVFADPVDDAGDALAGAAWGDWVAAPGTIAEGVNYLKIINGATPTQGVEISFTDNELVGADDASWSVTLADGIHYFYWEGTAGGIPSDAGSWTDNGLSGDGTATLGFSGAGNVLYVYYTVDLPDPLKDQDYAAGFTAATV